MVSIESSDGIEIISFSNERINALNVEDIKAPIMRLFEKPHIRAVIDLSGVAYFDSSGFALLLHLLRVARSNYGTFRLCGLTDPLKTLFEALRLNTAFDIYPDRATCIESFRHGGPA